MSTNLAATLGIAPDHLPALFAAIAAPALLGLAVAAARAAARQGVRPAARLVRSVDKMTATVRLTAVLLTMAGVIHIGVALAHAGGARGLLFLDGVAFLLLAGGAVFLRWWRPVAALLLTATVLAYTVAIHSGAEHLDQLGLATVLLEVTALGLVLSPHGLLVRHRALTWSAMVGSVIALGMLSGGAAWGAMLRSHDPESTAGQIHAGGADAGHDHGHDTTGSPATRGPAPWEAAALRLAEETKAAAVRYADVEVALADGYAPALGMAGPLPHYENRGHRNDNAVLDPARPEQLVYINTPDGLVLAGVVYVMPQPGLEGPAVGGPLTRWHSHSLCIAPVPGLFAGLRPPFGACPAGTVNYVTPAMMHVWIIDHPGGAFAERLDRTFLREVTGR